MMDFFFAIIDCWDRGAQATLSHLIYLITGLYSNTELNPHECAVDVEILKRNDKNLHFWQKIAVSTACQFQEHKLGLGWQQSNWNLRLVHRGIQLCWQAYLFPKTAPNSTGNVQLPVTPCKWMDSVHILPLPCFFARLICCLANGVSFFPGPFCAYTSVINKLSKQTHFGKFMELF